MSGADRGAISVRLLRLWQRSCTRWHPWGQSHTDREQLSISGSLDGRSAASRVLLHPVPCAGRRSVAGPFLDA